MSYQKDYSYQKDSSHQEISEPQITTRGNNNKRCFSDNDVIDIKGCIAAMRLGGASDRDVSDVLLNFILNH